MTTATLRKQARTLMWLVTVPLAGFVLILLVVFGNVVWQGGRFAEGVVIYYFPMLLYVWAIWMVRSAAKAVAAGAVLDRVVPRLLFRVGIALFGGALFTVFGVPLATALAYGAPHIPTFEPSPVTLGVVGAGLAFFSKLLDRAASLREELDEFV